MDAVGGYETPPCTAGGAAEACEHKRTVTQAPLPQQRGVLVPRSWPLPGTMAMSLQGAGRPATIDCRGRGGGCRVRRAFPPAARASSLLS